MNNPLSFTFNGHRNFNQEWPRHRNVSDLWQVQGLIHELGIEQALYAFQLSVFHIDAGLESFDAVSCSLDDLLKLEHHGGAWNLHSLHGEQSGEKLYVDDNSIIFGEYAQMLLDGDAVALRLRGLDFGLDLRLDMARGEVWHGRDGLLRFAHSGLFKRGMLFEGVLPSMIAGGKLYMGGNTTRMIGKAGFERLWGRFPLRRARAHWERFYLFFDNGDELLLTDFPNAIYHSGMWLTRRDGAKRLGEYALQAVDFLELDDWRFACGWRLHIPEYSERTLLLIPVDCSHYSLPVSRPVLAICDEQGRMLGRGFGELMHGARNELDKINLSIYFDAIDRQE